MNQSTDGASESPGQEPIAENAVEQAKFLAAAVVEWCEHLSTGLGTKPEHALAVAMVCCDAWLQLHRAPEPIAEPPLKFEEAFPRTAWFIEHGEERPPPDLIAHANKLDRDAAEILARALKLPEPFAGNLRAEARRLQGVANNYRLEHRDRKARHAEWEAARARPACHVAARDLAEALAAAGVGWREITARLAQLADLPGWPEPKQLAALALEATREDDPS